MRGSLTLDSLLMEAAHILPFEKVDVVNINNGSRLQTYVIAGPAGSGMVQLNGAQPAGELQGSRDYLDVRTRDPSEARSHTPRIVHVDERNRIVSIQ
jgi:aspartate 1-decarboxylase